MADFMKILEPGDWEKGFVNTVIEIPKGSNMKIEWDVATATFTLDRVEPDIFAKPANYGFIPKTLDDDGDPLDTLVVTDWPIPNGVWLKARVVGVLNFEDDGDMDYKVITVPADDRNTGDVVHSLDDIGKALKGRIEHHFGHYKDLKKPGSTKILGWGNIDDAKKVIKDSIDRYQNQG
jgi:inorganic pyrophosphatase